MHRARRIAITKTVAAVICVASGVYALFTLPTVITAAIGLIIALTGLAIGIFYEFYHAEKENYRADAEVRDKDQ